jgi:hypothetical protein
MSGACHFRGRDGRCFTLLLEELYFIVLAWRARFVGRRGRWEILRLRLRYRRREVTLSCACLEEEEGTPLSRCHGVPVVMAVYTGLTVFYDHLYEEVKMIEEEGVTCAIRGTPPLLSKPSKRVSPVTFLQTSWSTA